MNTCGESVEWWQIFFAEERICMKVYSARAKSEKGHNVSREKHKFANIEEHWKQENAHIKNYSTISWKAQTKLISKEKKINYRLSKQTEKKNHTVCFVRFWRNRFDFLSDCNCSPRNRSDFSVPVWIARNFSLPSSAKILLITSCCIESKTMKLQFVHNQKKKLKVTNKWHITINCQRIR